MTPLGDTVRKLEWEDVKGYVLGDCAECGQPFPEMKYIHFYRRTTRFRGRPPVVDFVHLRCREK